MGVDIQNLAYALIQVVHNFGAAGVVGGAVAARLLAGEMPAAQRRLAWLVLFGWLAQAASGAGFGAVSHYFYGRFPDLHDLALAALLVKLACAAGGALLAAVFLRQASGWPAPRCRAAWNVLIGLAATALTAAAFLRWFA